MSQVKDTGGSARGVVPHFMSSYPCTSRLCGVVGALERSAMMTKSGASGPKARARKAQQATGAKYTNARAGRAPRQRRGRVVQFLTGAHHDLGGLGGLSLQIAASWARNGLRVLILHEYEGPPVDLRLYSRRVRERRAAEARVEAWPGHRSTLLWQPASPREHDGELVEQHTPWYLPSDKPGRLQRDESPLGDALTSARAHFDAVVLMGGTSWARTEHVDDFVLLASLRDGIPVSQRIARKAGRKEEVVEHPLTPQQSAALLRDRHLQSFDHRSPVPFLGMAGVLTPRRRRTMPSVESGFRAGLEDDMRRAGLPLLGFITTMDHWQDADEPSAVLASPPDHGVDDVAAAIRAAW